MLCLCRQVEEEIEIWLPDGRTVVVRLLEIRGPKVKLGFTADRDISVHRFETAEAIRRENRAAAQVREA